jgi:hypothetical protein
MALRDQPYIKLFCQDYLTDEKLILCSYATQGIYVRIICVLHKSETYGGILFKQIPKQNFESTQYFAYVLSRQTGVPMPEMDDALEELIYNDVMTVGEVDNVPFLYQKRMIKDFETSLERSDAGKKGGEHSILLKQNPKQKNERGEILLKQKSKQTPKQNPEHENEDEKDHLHFPPSPSVTQGDISVAVKECVVAESIGTPEGAGAGARAAGPAPPKKSEPVKHKHGQYGWVRLTADEYNRLLEEWGNETLRKYIAIVDEYAQKTGNAKKYKDWNLVVREAKRDKWGEGRKQEQNVSKPSTVNGRKLYGYEQRALDELRRADADADG